jgi:hypothetical protein
MSRKLLMIVLIASLLLAAASPSAVVLAGGRASSNLFAVVDKSGNLVSGGGVSSVTHLGTGQYEVTFITEVSQCAYLATTRHTYSQAIQAFTAGGHLSANGVYVETKNQGGGLTDGVFNLVVVCGGVGMDFAVVGYDAELVRSSGASLVALGSGRYEVTFGSDIAHCAYLATVGDPGNGLVFNPAGAYTGSGPTTATVYVETKNIAGGLQDGVPFHLGVICPEAADARVAVVLVNGVIDRGSPLTSSFRLDRGEYKVVTNASIALCAKIATRGSVDTDVPFTPATVEIKGGPAANTVGIQVRDLLFFGGDLINQEFHAAIVC